VRFHATGKVALDHIYTQPDPRAYFGTLRGLEYGIPQLAKPYFRRLIDAYRPARQVPLPKVLDLGCSYGINGALLNCNATMSELYERYCGPDAVAQTRDRLLTRDRQLVQARRRIRTMRLVGLDISIEALEYARSAGFIEDAVHANLEDQDPSDRQRAQLTGTDVIISTGCVGYVTEQTIARLVEAAGERRPWMAHFVLRMFPFEPVTECLDGLGYQTHRLDRPFRQRRFANRQEQLRVLDTLADIGLDPRGLETDGWLYAQLYLCRPRVRPGRTVVDLATIRTGG
jgi:carnitine O-acetyltransferase